MERKENKMGVMPVTKLVITMSLPIMASMLIQALYNVVDSIFVSRISEEALTAVSLSFPIQNLMIGLASGTAVGVNALLSKSLGEKEYERANKIAANGVVLSIVGFLIFFVIGLTNTQWFFKSQTNVSDIVSGGATYLNICCLLSFGIFGQLMFERLMQSTGKTIFTMFTQGTGAIINIIFDPLLIFGIGPFPKLGIAGAAYATVFGQIVACGMAIFFNHKFNKEIKVSFKKFRPDFAIMGRICYIGVPSVIMVATGSVMNYLMNKILISFTETAAAVFGVYFKLQSFVFMPIFGLNNGIIPIIAYNYGARNRLRMMKTVKVAVAFAVSLMAIGLALMQTIPHEMLKLFNASEHMMTIGIPALRIISLCFVFAGVCIAIGSVFQALGKSVFSMIVSISRQIIVLVPVAYLFSLTGDVTNVWYAFPIAEIMSVAVSVAGFAYIYRKIIKPLPDGAPV